MNRIPPPDDAAHQDGRLMHEVSKVNDQLSRYVLRFLDADAGRAAPLSPADEQALAERVADLAHGIRMRAERRATTENPPLTIESDTQTE